MCIYIYIHIYIYIYIHTYTYLVGRENAPIVSVVGGGIMMSVGHLPVNK